MKPCNCENSLCTDHLDEPEEDGYPRVKPCERPATGSHRVMYIGHVCYECWLKHELQYRLGGS